VGSRVGLDAVEKCQTLIQKIEIVSLEMDFSILNIPERSVKNASKR
jgi:hypothetical protein